MQNKNAYRPPSWDSVWSTSPTQADLIKHYQLEQTPESWTRLNAWQNSTEARQAFVAWEQQQQQNAAAQAKSAEATNKG